MLKVLDHDPEQPDEVVRIVERTVGEQLAQKQIVQVSSQVLRVVSQKP